MLLIIKRLVHGALTSVLLLLAACAPHSTNYSIGGTVTGLVGTGLTNSLVLQDNGGDNLTVSANGGFTFATKITGCNGSTSASGVSSTSCGVYSVSIFTQPLGLTCTVTNGSGTATGNVSNVLVNCTGTNSTASQHFAYVANAGDGTVSQYTIASNGTLTAMTMPTVMAGTTPYSVTVDPLGKFAYVANSGSNNVSEYTIDASSGALTQAGTVTAGMTPYSLTIANISGQEYVYVANEGANTISQYTIGSTGTLTPMSPSTVTSGANPYFITVDPLGKYVYVANEGANTISQYTIGTGGALTPMVTATVASGPNPYSITIANISGQEYAYVANSNYANLVNNSSSISQYTIGTNGALTPMNPSTVAAGTNPVSVAVDNSGQYAYVANYGSNNVSQYTIGTSGALTAMSSATVAAGTSPYSITIDPLSQFIYVANYGGYNVSQYTIGAGGLLTPIASATTVAAGTHPVSVIAAQ